MNPILAAMRAAAGRQNPRSQAPTAGPDFNQILADIKAGRADPKTEVAKFIGRMSGAQKNRLRAALPLLQAIASRQGVDGGTIQQVTSELQARMQ